MNHWIHSVKKGKILLVADEGLEAEFERIKADLIARGNEVLTDYTKRESYEETDSCIAVISGFPSQKMVIIANMHSCPYYAIVSNGSSMTSLPMDVADCWDGKETLA